MPPVGGPSSLSLPPSPSPAVAWGVADTADAAPRAATPVAWRGVDAGGRMDEDGVASEDEGRARLEGGRLLTTEADKEARSAAVEGWLRPE